MSNIDDYFGMAMLDLTDGERELLGRRLSEAEAGFAALELVDTDGVAPLVSVLELTNVLREDVSVKLFSRDEILSNAPEQYDGYFQVPGTI